MKYILILLLSLPLLGAVDTTSIFMTLYNRQGEVVADNIPTIAEAIRIANTLPAGRYKLVRRTVFVTVTKNVPPVAVAKSYPKKDES